MYIDQVIKELSEYFFIVAIIIEVYIAFLIWKEYLKARNSLLSPQSLQSLLEENISAINIIDSNLMITELIELMGSQRSTESIRSVIRKYLVSSNDRIRHLANLGPAFGLLFTFIGMFLTVREISSVPFGTNIDILSQNFSNLFPVFIGGATGILVYAIGMMLLSRLQTAQNTVENELLKTFLVFESNNEPPKPRKVEDVYERLLKRLKLFLNRLDSINAKFEKLSNQTDSLITNFAEKTNNFIDKFDERIFDLNTKFNSNLNALETSSKKIADLNSIFTDSAKQWKESAVALSDFSRSILQTEDRLQKLTTIAENVSKLVGSLDLNTNNINKLVNWVEQDRLEFHKLEEEIKKLADSVAALKNNAEKLLLFWENPIKEVLESIISEIKNKVEVPLTLPSSLIDFPKDLKKDLEGIKILLEKISNDGHRLKTQTVTNSPDESSIKTSLRIILQMIKTLLSRNKTRS